MSSELIAILAVGIGLLTANAGLAALLVTLIIHFDKRATERGDRLQDEMNRQFELMQADMNRFGLMPRMSASGGLNWVRPTWPDNLTY